MELTKMNLTEFCHALASKEPAPGGGSAAAMAGAMGIGLTAMVANLTVGKKKYAEHEELMQQILTEATALQEGLIAAIDRDTEAYNGVSAVFAIPKETDEDKAKRAAAMQAALKTATLVPYEVMGLCGKALAVTQRAVGRSNTNCTSDLGVAALNLSAAATGAWMNVLINLGGIKDGEFAGKIKADGEAMMAKMEKASRSVINQVMGELNG